MQKKIETLQVFLIMCTLHEIFEDPPVLMDFNPFWDQTKLLLLFCDLRGDLVHVSEPLLTPCYIVKFTQQKIGCNDWNSQRIQPYVMDCSVESWSMLFFISCFELVFSALITKIQVVSGTQFGPVDGKDWFCNKQCQSVNLAKLPVVSHLNQSEADFM